MIIPQEPNLILRPLYFKRAVAQEFVLLVNHGDYMRTHDSQSQSVPSAVEGSRVEALRSRTSFRVSGLWLTLVSLG